MEFAAIIIAFIFLPVFIRIFPRITGKKANFGLGLGLTGLLMALIGGLGFSDILGAVKEIFVPAGGGFGITAKVQTMLVIIMIGIMGGIMKQYGILTKVVDALSHLIPNRKTTVMMMPAIMGLLPIPGGAYLSAPFVDAIGSDLNMHPARKVAINLYFRHFSMFVLPYGTTLLIVNNMMPEVSVYKLIAFNLGFVACLLIGGYFMFVRKVPAVIAESKGEKSRGKYLFDLLFNLAPVYMVLFFNGLLGLPMYLAVLCCVLLTFFIIGRDKSKWLSSAWKGIKLDPVYIIIGVYFIQGIVQRFGTVTGTVTSIFESSSTIGVLVIIPLVSLLFGLSTGNNLVPCGILLPLVAALPFEPITKTIYAFYILVWGFFGYFYSPFHLCQILSIETIPCMTKDVYKEHSKMLPILIVGAMALFFVYSIIF